MQILSVNININIYDAHYFTERQVLGGRYKIIHMEEVFIHTWNYLDFEWIPWPPGLMNQKNLKVRLD